MGKQKDDQPATNLDGSDPAGAAGGAKDMATAGTAGAVPAKPADALSAAAPTNGDQPAVEPAAADTGAAVAGAAVAAGSKEAEKELGDGQEAQTPADGEQVGAAPGQRDLDGKNDKAPRSAGGVDSGAADQSSNPGAAGQSDAGDGADHSGDTASSGNAGAVGDGPITVFDDAAAALAASSVGLSVLGNQPAGDDEGGPNSAFPDDDLDDDLELDTAFTVAQFARACAGAGTIFANDGRGMTRGQEFKMREAEIMAAFVRFNPEAPLLAMYKHLELTLRLPQTQPNNADMLALAMFRHACLAAFEYERCEAAERAAAEFNATPAASWGGATALDPIPPALQPTGFRPL